MGVVLLSSARCSRAQHVVSVVVTPPVLEPLTIEEAKLRAGFDWATGDARELLLAGYIRAARAKVEQDTGLALLTQTRDVYFDAVWGLAIALPAQSLPLQAVTSVKSVDAAGVEQTLTATEYVVDAASGRIGLAESGSWPTDLRTFQPWVIRVVAGWTSVQALTTAAPLLVHAVGLLTAHYATLGRDLASVESATEIPQGYADAISAYVPVVVA
jgi:uncharacterized phiE125 gp8 family phage protein